MFALHGHNIYMFAIYIYMHTLRKMCVERSRMDGTRCQTVAVSETAIQHRRASIFGVKRGRLWRWF